MNPSSRALKSGALALIAAASMAAAPVAAVAAAASAAPAAPILTPAKGAEVSLSVTVSRPVVNDEAVVDLAITREGKTAKEAQAKLLADLNPAMKAIRGAVKSGTSEFQTGQLYTNANYAQRKPGDPAKVVSWTARQSVTVTLKDTAEAGALVEAASKDFEFSGLRFQVSKAAARRNRSELMGEALEDLAGKAAVIARSMAIPVSEVKLAAVDFGSASLGNSYRPARMMAKAAAAPMASAPADLEAGETEVSLTAAARFTVGEKVEKKEK